MRIILPRPGHFEECIDFGARVGFIEPEQAEKIRKTGGKGPGGCDSPDVCKAFCAEPNNQEECFRFGKEHGLINEDEVREAKEGFVRLRAGLENAPKEVSACLTSVLGPTIIEDIQSGTMTPGPEIGERVRGCFEKFGHRGDSKRIFEDAPKEVLSCVREKLGDAFEEIRSGKKSRLQRWPTRSAFVFKRFTLRSEVLTRMSVNAVMQTGLTICKDFFAPRLRA